MLICTKRYPNEEWIWRYTHSSIADILPVYATVYDILTVARWNQQILNKLYNQYCKSQDSRCYEFIKTLLYLFAEEGLK